MSTPKTSPVHPVLRFTPDTWAKLLWFRDHGTDKEACEIGGYGITSADDLLLITQFQTVKQIVSLATVAFDDDAIADYFDDQIDYGRQPFEFSRIWLHTHPGNSAHPSPVDEETFERLYGAADWAIMFILAKGGATYARLSFNTGPQADLLLDVQVDYTQPFQKSDHEAWLKEYTQNIEVKEWTVLDEKDALPYQRSHYYGGVNDEYYGLGGGYEKAYDASDYDWENDWKNAHPDDDVFADTEWFDYGETAAVPKESQI